MSVVFSETADGSIIYHGEHYPYFVALSKSDSRAVMPNILTLVLRPETTIWLCENIGKMDKSWATTFLLKREGEKRRYIKVVLFKNLEHMVLFKLTWCGA